MILTREVARKSELIRDRLQLIADDTTTVELDVRGRGMMLGLGCPDCPALADAVSAA